MTITRKNGLFVAMALGAAGAGGAALAACGSDAAPATADTTDGGDASVPRADAAPGADANGGADGAGDAGGNDAGADAADAGGDASDAGAIDPSKAARFLYALDGNGSNVNMFPIDLDSGLIPNVQSYVSGSEPTYGVATPDAKFLYTVNTQDGTVTPWTEDSTPGSGFLGKGKPAATGTTPRCAAMHPSGAYLYVTNNGDDTVSSYTIGGDGALTAMGNPAASTAGPHGCAIDPQGKFLVVAGNKASKVSVFPIGAGGALGARDDTTLPGSPVTVVAHPTLEVVYVVTSATHQVTAYAVGSGTPALTSLGSKSTGSAADPQPLVAAVHPNGALLYVSNNADTALDMFPLDATGALGAVTHVTVPTSGRAISVDPAGKWLYLNTDDDRLHAFSLDSAGAPTPLNNGNAPGAMSFRNPIVAR